MLNVIQSKALLLFILLSICHLAYISRLYYYYFIIKEICCEHPPTHIRSLNLCFIGVRAYFSYEYQTCKHILQEHILLNIVRIPMINDTHCQKNTTFYGFIPRKTFSYIIFCFLFIFCLKSNFHGIRSFFSVISFSVSLIDEICV